MRIGVFVINYNGLSMLGNVFLRALESFSRLSNEFEGVDVWLVDNGSSDGSAKVVRERFGDAIKTIVLGRNVGYGAAFNIAYLYTLRKGLRYAYYVCSNNDIVVYEDRFEEFVWWLSRLEKVFPNGFIAGPILISGYGEGLDEACHYIDHLGRPWPLRSVVSTAEKLVRFLMAMPIPVSYVDGAFMALHRKVVERIQFDSKLFLYGEDLEICCRAWLYGIPSLLIPVILGKHYRSSSTKVFRPLTTYLKTRNHIYTTRCYTGTRGLLRTVMHYLRLLARGLGLSIVRRSGIDGLEMLRIVVRGIMDGMCMKCENLPRAKNRGYIPIINLPLKSIILPRIGARAMQNELSKLVLRHAKRWISRGIPYQHSRG